MVRFEVTDKLSSDSPEILGGLRERLIAAGHNCLNGSVTRLGFGIVPKM